MRIAYTTWKNRRRDAFDANPIDADWLAETSAEHEFEVWVGEDSEADEDLRRHGINVTTAPQRFVDVPGKGRISSEHVVATLIAEAHERKPFDAILYGPSKTVDAAWFEPGLKGIPKGMVLSGGIIYNNAMIRDDPALAANFGLRLWATASFAASCDFVVSAVSTDDLGLTFELPIWNPLSESPQLAQPDDSRLVVVVATGEDRSGLASLMRRVVQRVPFESNTSFVVITPHLRVGVETSGQLITAGCPDDLRLSTIVVEPSGDGIAGQFCRAADLIVAARPQDAMIPAVQGSRSSLLVLAGARPSLRTSFSLPQTEPAEPSVLLVPSDDGLDSAVAIMEANEDTEIFVLHGSSAGPDVARLLTTPPSRFDVAVLGKPHPISGAAELGQLVPDVLVVHRDAVRPLSRWVTDVESLGELTGLVSRSELAHSLRRLVLPAISSSTFEIVEDVRLDAVPEWAGATGPIGRINQEAVRRASDLTHGSTSPRISPNRTDTREIRSWAKEHTWGDRIRLALPWKWGLLPRAMRGRW